MVHFFFKKMGSPKNKKRLAKSRLLKMENIHSFKSKRKGVQESKFPLPFAIWCPPNKKMGGLLTMCPFRKMKKMGVPKKKREIPILLTHFLVPIFPLCLAVTHSLSQLPTFNPACDQNVNALFLD